MEGRIGEGPTYKYKARLSPEDYDRAVRAHRRGLDVILHGDVVLLGHQYRVNPMRELTVIGGLEDEP